MRRLVGLVFLLIGLAPILAAIWPRHVYTVGLAIDTKAVVVLSVLVLADLSLLVGGTYLVIRSN